MRLPELEFPEKYSGLYVFELGGQVAVGYTADEIAILLESEKYAEGKIYRIHRALPDGTMELAGVPRERFTVEDGLFFYRGHIEQARSDFQLLANMAGRNTPPCRMKLHLATLVGASHPCLTAIIFPAEFTNEVADWLNAIGFNGGDLVEGGPSQVTRYYDANPAVMDRRQLMPAATLSRPAEEVLSTTHLSVQRKLA